MDLDYKSRKEAFVSNLTGGSLLEINAVTLVAPASVFLWSVLQSRLSFFTPYAGPAAVITDFLLNVLAILFATTLYSSAPWLLNLLLISPAILILFSSRPRRVNIKAKPPKAATPQNAPDLGSAPQSLPVHPFLTTYRAAMMIITCIAILAVDFRVFPRRFAKAENWGTSLMDLGVGSFVFSGGVVSARSVLKGASVEKTLAQRLTSSIRPAVPLLILGLIRLYTVKNLEYAEHVTEYGVHWNFFFTLGFLPLFVEIFEGLATIIPSYEVLSLAVAVLYQVALESTDLKAYILVSPRGADLLSKNREGVFSFLGYLAIFLAGRATGIRIIPSGISPSTTPPQARKRVLTSLAVLASGYSAVFAMNSTYFLGYGAGIPVSRRLANMPYVLWVAAFNNTQLFLFCLIETLFFPSVHRVSTVGKAEEAERTAFATSPIMKAFNRGGLAIFLIANLLTGGVNLTVPTLDVNDGQAMVILVAYAAVITAVALGLDKANIKIAL
ncbi:GWT1-domain-containing protein [Aspergillus crustosus]